MNPSRVAAKVQKARLKKAKPLPMKKFKVWVKSQIDVRCETSLGILEFVSKKNLIHMLERLGFKSGMYKIRSGE